MTFSLSCRPYLLSGLGQKKMFGCTPPTDSMFEAYPNLFFYLFIYLFIFYSQQKNHKIYQEKTENAEKSS